MSTETKHLIPIMLIDDKPKYIMHENTEEGIKAAANELGECLKNAMSDCYANNTMTKEAYIGNIQIHFGKAVHQLTFEPDMEITLVDQYGKPWVEVKEQTKDNFVNLPLFPNTFDVLGNLPKVLDQNSNIQDDLVEKQLSESERQKIYLDIVEYGKSSSDLGEFKDYVEKKGSWLTKEEKDALYDWWNECYPKTKWWQYPLMLLPFFWTGCSSQKPEAPKLKPKETEAFTETPTENTTEKTTDDTDMVTSQMMKDFGWPLSDDEIVHLNEVLKKYGITDMRSIRLFMATCAHESGKGSKSLEMLNKDGSTVGDYLPTERGAGYIQITHKDTHQQFLDSINDKFSGTDTATYIAEKYPWEAAAWFWGTTGAKSMNGGISLNEYVIKYGDIKGVYLITQYTINGWPESKFDQNAEKIRDGKVDWESKNGRLYVKGEEICRLPNGWNNKDNINNRENTYNEAIKIFK